MSITTRFHNATSVNSGATVRQRKPKWWDWYLPFCFSPLIKLLWFVNSFVLFFLSPLTLGTWQSSVISPVYSLSFQTFFAFLFTPPNDSPIDISVHSNARPFPFASWALVRMDPLKWINSSTYHQIAKHHVFLFPFFLILHS